jgi:NAD(P)-dependent dehydrogenase (short-subunit alcohol dehydrogenase family)
MFEGKTAIVTGGAQGLGFEISAELLRRGADVILLDVAHEHAIEAARLLTVQWGGKAVARAVHGSVLLADDIQSAFDSVDGPVQLLVNSAGVVASGLIAELDEEVWDRVVDVCLKGVFMVSREFARRAGRLGAGGAIVNVSSLNGTVPSEGAGAYCAAKAGVTQLTKVCALELAPHGVRVNAVAPGSTRSAPIAAMEAAGSLMVSEWLARTPLGRLGEPLDIALATAFLLSEDARWITGACIPVDGGMHARGLHNYHSARNVTAS